MRVCENGIYRDMTEEEIANLPTVTPEERIAELKSKLADTDYIACKIAEGVATKEEYAEVIVQRQLWRKEINALGDSVCEITAEEYEEKIAESEEEVCQEY